MKSMKIVLSLLFFSCLCFSAAAQNMVRNGNFESGIGSWKTNVVDAQDTLAEPPTAQASFSAVSPGLGGSKKALFVEVVQPGKLDRYITASGPLSIQTNNSYEISFRAVSTKNRTISIGVYTDVNSDSAFFSQVIEINGKDMVYGPFKLFYNEKPVHPGLKLNFGGMDGNVTVDDILVKHVETVTEIITNNSLEDIIGDITLPHEGLPHGVWNIYDWGKAPRKGSMNPPDDWTAAIAWGQLYEWKDGNPANNTRVQIRDLAMYYLSKTDSGWHKLQSAVRVEGAAYVEDFVGDVNKPADIRKEPDGSISVTAGDGYNFHFWPSTGRVTIPKGDVLGCFVTVNARLILHDPNGIDDRNSARYLMGVGGDWWQSMDAVWDNWKTNWDMGIGRFRFVTNEWQGFNLITLSPEQTKLFPPPLPFVTAAEKNMAFPANGPLNLNNYPNPFSINTKIEYYLPNNSKVVVDIYNIEGKHLSTLVDEFQLAGMYKVNFNADSLNEGVYFYSLTTGNNRETKKMIVSK
jgi:hypothetical protein